MAIARVALIFDNLARPETTGVYCRRALGNWVDVEHFLPTEIAKIPRGHFDLVLAVDDGLNCPLPTDLRPLAYWAIDTHLDFERALTRGRQCDLVFAAQKDGALQLRAAGIAGAVWLPLACDPELHRPHDLPKRFDVCFVGNVFPGPRRELLDQIQREFPNSFVGQRYFDDMARTYSESRVVFNRSLKNDVNMRVFEALSCGSLLITNDLAENGQAELFGDGEHLVTYSDADELLDKLRFYLQHDELREQIAHAGRRAVLARHTYKHRMKAVLDAAGQLSHASPPSKPTSPERPRKEAAYFEFDRPEVVSLVPLTARRVLDIGCGAGRLGAAIKQRQPVEVVGIELNPEAAADAQLQLDQVIVGNIETDAIDFPEDRFDCVVCADVLEHLREPRPVLEKIRRWLTPDGALVISVPNVRNHTVIRALLDGNWTYESAGLLDQDHVRFFTRREIEKLLFRAGFQVKSLTFVPGEGFAEWERLGRPPQATIGGLQIQVGTAEDAAEFFAYQYLVVAQPEQRPVVGLTSIILVTHNQLAYTRQCLDSIRLRTDEPYELIVVDNGSTDGTVEFLQSLGGLTVIVNRENRGFPGAANQGLRAARGTHLLLLNNDTLVTTGWLRRMLDALASTPDVGLVGPVSNQVSGEQQVAVSYRRLESLDGFAWEWGKRHAKEHIETDRLVGFCLLAQREVVDRIGLLDEQFGLGNFEDDDYCRRAIQAGYRCIIARDAFVHHFGGQTFLASDIDFARLMEENRKKYDAKWNDVRPGNGEPGIKTRAPEPIVPSANPASASNAMPNDRTRNVHPCPPRFSLAQNGSAGLRLKQNPIKLSVCLIVRDNERTIGPALDSICPWVDEIVVVDTGSQDRTPDICRQYGACLHYFPWCDDFSAARNESLRHARGDWIFWMDSDDTISPECGRQLRALAERRHPDRLLGFVMQVHCPDPAEDGFPETTVVDHVKLFRNRPDLRFEGRIHEQILPAIRRAGGEVEFTEIHVVHSGYDRSPAGQQRKLERDLRILHRDLEERPEHPFILFNLGMTYLDARQFERAIDFLERSLGVSQATESHVRKAYALLLNALFQAGRYEAAEGAAARALDLFPDDKELLFRAAMLDQHQGRLPAAENKYRQVLQGREARHFTSIDRELAGYKAHHNLALVYEELGRPEQAAEQWALAQSARSKRRPDQHRHLAEISSESRNEQTSHRPGALVQ